MSSDSNIKEVKVSLNPLDEKALSRTSTRRRRTSRKATTSDEQLGGGESDPVHLIQKDTTQLPAPQLPAPQLLASQPLAPQQPASQPSAPQQPASQPSAPQPSAPQPQLQVPQISAPEIAKPMAGGSAQKVKIAAKKGGQTFKAPTFAKLLPKKRLSSAAPAATLKKQRIPIRSPQTSPILKKGGAILNVPTVPSAPQEAPKPALSTTTVVGGASQMKKRRFTERKIHIDLKQVASTRKQRLFVKSKIATMPIATVKKMLIRKGLLKLKASTPPESMMRNLLKDYYLLHAAE